MILPQLLSQIVELGANQLIALDPDSQVRLQSIQGSIIKIEFYGLQSQLYLLIHAEEIEVMSTFEGEVDTVISGAPLDLVALGKGKGDLFSSNVNISGDLEVAKKFSRYLNTVNIDWEEHLSKIVGDAVAYQIGGIFRKANTYFDKTKNSIREDISEYLVEESRHVAVKSEVEHFVTDIDKLRAFSDRLEKRISILEKAAGYST